MSNAIELVVFGILAAGMLGGAFGMLSTRNVIHAAFWLLEISTAGAGMFALLNASYVALIQLLVYAGAVAILNIFTIMITMRRREDAVRPRDFSVAGLLLAMSFFVLVAVALLGSPNIPTTTVDVFPGVAEFGAALFSIQGWAWPFEVASLVLTAALVAAVWWSREEDER